jgi:hypothetical protein
MKEYTEEIHAKMLLKMLGKEDPCSCCNCPSAIANGKYGWSRFKTKNPVCIQCMAFLELPIFFTLLGGCPCGLLGDKEAIKQTWLKLEEKGYI